MLMLKRKRPLKSNTSIKAKKSLRQSYAEKILSGEKKNKPIKSISKKKQKNKKPYWSIFTNTMNVCIITGTTKESGAVIDPHHIFGAADKGSSEKYGFMLPLRRDWHEVANYSIHMDKMLDLKYKLKCQEYWINVLHKTEQEFRKEFRKWYEVKDKTA